MTALVPKTMFLCQIVFIQRCHCSQNAVTGHQFCCLYIKNDVTQMSFQRELTVALTTPNCFCQHAVVVHAMCLPAPIPPAAAILAAMINPVCFSLQTCRVPCRPSAKQQPKGQHGCVAHQSNKPFQLPTARTCIHSQAAVGVPSQQH